MGRAKEKGCKDEKGALQRACCIFKWKCRPGLGAQLLDLVNVPPQRLLQAERHQSSWDMVRFQCNVTILIYMTCNSQHLVNICLMGRSTSTWNHRFFGPHILMRYKAFLHIELRSVWIILTLKLLFSFLHLFRFYLHKLKAFVLSLSCSNPGVVSHRLTR